MTASAKVQTILWRVCWNDCGWQKPSGGFKEPGYPADHGFGHEEWNFRLEDAVGGRIHGYIYKTRIKRAGATFRVVFFAIEPHTKERIVVGIYRAAEFIPPKDRDALYAAFTQQGIFQRRAAELRRATKMRYTQREALEFVHNAVHDPVLMIRCPVADVEISRTRIPLGRISGDQSVGHRFKSFTYLEDDTYFQGRRTRLPAGGRRWLRPQIGELSEESYYRDSTAARKVIIPRHRKLSNAFCRWLRTAHRATGIQERECIDVRCEVAGRDVLAELKICYGASERKAIRESLGQLLEYNHYCSRRPAQEWLVVLDLKPRRADCDYIDTLRTAWRLPLFLGWRTSAGFSFHPPWP